MAKCYVCIRWIVYTLYIHCTSTYEEWTHCTVLTLVGIRQNLSKKTLPCSRSINLIYVLVPFAVSGNMGFTVSRAGASAKHICFLVERSWSRSRSLRKAYLFFSGAKLEPEPEPDPSKLGNYRMLSWLREKLPPELSQNILVGGGFQLWFYL